MVDWLAGKRIKGTSSERTTGTWTGLPSGSVGGWVELGRTTLSSPATSITVSSLPNKRYYMYLVNTLDDTNIAHNMSVRLNSDTANNYAWRRSFDGGADSTTTSTSNMQLSSWQNPEFGVGYLANYSSKEKLMVSHSVSQNTAGAGNAPHRQENVGKWVNTSDAIDEITVYYPAGAYNYGTNSELVVLGYDPADTHSSNFWQELASVDLSGGANRYLSSGTFTTKKYLWIQTFLDYGSGSTLYGQLRVGNGSVDTGTNYSHRYSSNGGSDLTNTSIGYLPHAVNTLNSAGEGIFINTFIINNASNEKLMINHITENYITTAGTAPARREEVAKWANTSNQINIVEYDGTSGHTFGTNSIMKVWGAD